MKKTVILFAIIVSVVLLILPGCRQIEDTTLDPSGAPVYDEFVFETDEPTESETDEEEEYRLLMGTITKRLFINGSVDLELHDSDRNFMARIVNNVVDDSDSTWLANSGLYVDGDTKVFTVPTNCGEFTLKITATDNGIMNFTVADLSVRTHETGNAKEFADIVLETGKEFTIALSSDDLMKNVKLYVTKNGSRIAEVATDGTEIPIATDAND